MTNINTFQGDVFIHQYIKHTGDDTTYFGFSADDAFTIATNNVSRLSVSASSGAVTIANDLYVSEYLRHTGDTDTNIRFTDDNLRIYTGGTERFHIDSSGTVAIAGALTAGSFNTSQISAGTLGTARGGTGTTSVTGSGNLVLSASPTFSGTAGFSMVNASGYIASSTLQDASDSASTTNQIVVNCTNSSGYAGTGGGITFCQRYYQHSSAMISTGGVFGGRLGGNNGSYGGGLVFKYNPGNSMTPGMVLESSGYVGIGTTNPAYKVHVTGTQHHIGWWQNNKASCYVSAQNSISTRCYFGADGQGFISNEPTSSGIYNSGTGNINYFNNGARRFQMHGNGVFHAQGFGIYSDERIKDNITDVDDAKSIEIIKQLQPKNYVMRENRDEKKWGFIAQDVEQIVPEGVSSTGTGTVYINKKYAITEYNPPVKLVDIVYSNVSITDYASLDANVQAHYVGPDSNNTYYSNIVADAIYSKSNVSALITDEVFVVDDCVKLSVDETYSLNVCCLNVTSVSSNVYVFQDDCRMTAEDHDLPDMNLTDFIYIKSKEIENAKTIDYEFMNPILVSAMQQLIRTVDDLKERVTVLENT